LIGRRRKLAEVNVFGECAKRNRGGSDDCECGFQIHDFVSTHLYQDGSAAQMFQNSSREFVKIPI
jgi:hypothetical protein